MAVQGSVMAPQMVSARAVVGASAARGERFSCGSAPDPSQRDCGGYTGELHRYENSELMEQPDVQAQLVLAVAAGGHWNDTVL